MLERFSKIEIKILERIQKITQNFKVEISGHLDFRNQGSFYIDYIGDETSTNWVSEQLNFHTHPSDPNQWLYGGPPSLSDIKICFSEIQRTDYIIGKKLIYRLYEGDNVNKEIIKKIEDNIGFYHYLGQVLESGNLILSTYIFILQSNFNLMMDVIILN